MRTVVATSIAMLLAGCATIPTGGTAGVAPVARVIDAVRCEVQAAFAAGVRDPANLATWPALVTVTTTLASNATVQPGLTATAGKSGKLAWKAPSLTSKASSVATRTSVVDYEISVLDRVQSELDCASASPPAVARGLDLGAWLRQTAAGMPEVSTQLKIKQIAYKKTFTVNVTAAGGLSFTVNDFSLTLDGNSAGQTNTYEIDMQLKEPPKAVVAAALAGNLNNRAYTDFFQELRDQRDEDKDKETTITLAPGQSIIIE